MKKLVVSATVVLCIVICSMSLTGCFLFHSHEYSQSNVSPTCEGKGYTLYSCSCGDSYRKNEVPALGHTTVQDSAVEASCTQTGLSAGSHCSVCGKTIVAQTTIAKLEHQDEEHDGYCNVCNTHFEEIIEINNINDLKAINSNLNGSYRMSADISLSGADWIALGTSSQPFTGKLYGMGHSISGLSLSNKAEGGLFAYNSGTIDGITIKDFSLSLNNMTGVMGGLVAYNKGNITNCKTAGSFTVSNTNSHYEKKSWPSYDGTKVSYTGTFGGLCAVNEGKISKCELNSTFSCDYKNTNEYQLSVAFPYFECGHSSSCMSTIYFGGVAGKNSGTIEDCTVTGLNSNTVHLLAKYNNHGTSTATTNAYIGALVGSNSKTILNCSAKKSNITKDVGATSLKESNMNTYGIVCNLNLYEDTTYTGIVGNNSGSISNLLYYN